MTEHLPEKYDKHPIDLHGQGLCWFCGSGYSFITDLLRRGAIRPLTADDVPPLPAQMESGRNYERISLPPHGSPGSLHRALWRGFRREIIFVLLWACSFLVVKLATPLAFWWLLEALRREPEDGGLPWWHLWASALSLPLLGWAIAITVAATQYHATMLAVAMRQTLSVVVYKAVLGMPAFNKNLGAASSALSVDTERVYLFCMEGFFVPIAAGLISGGCAILFSQVRWAAFPAVFILCLGQYLQKRIGKRIGQTRKNMSVWTDRRVALSTQLMQGIRPIRMNGWDPSLRQQIQDLRDNELKALKQVQAWKALNYMLSAVTPQLCVALVLVFHALFQGAKEATPEVFFVVISVVNPCIRMALELIPRLIGLYVEAHVAVSRIEKLLTQSCENPRNCIEPLPADAGSASQFTQSSPLLLMEDASFAWPGAAEDAFQLRDLRLRVQKGQLICILGKVGSGKSALIAALLGELEKISGVARAARAKDGKAKPHDGPFLAGHCAQQPWVQSVTVRENVLLAGLAQRALDGRAINEDNYRKAIAVTQLLPDIERWPAGDAAEVGERGLTLSGGQKARVSLARATYAVLEGMAQALFLDDVLAALDGVVAQRIVEECILDAVAGVSRVIVLSSPHAILRHADAVYYMEEGKLREVTSEELEIPDPVDTKDVTMSKVAVEEQAVEVANAEAGKLESGKLYQTEGRVEGGLKIRAVVQYFGWASGGRKASLCRTASVLGLFALTELVRLSVDSWLIFWTNVVSERVDEPIGAFGTLVDKSGAGGVAVAGVLCLLLGVCACMRSTAFLHWALSCSRHVYTGALRAVSSASLTEFFDLTPSGRLVTCFSRDSDILDSVLPDMMQIVLIVLIDLVASLLVCGVTTPTYLVLVPYLLYYSVKTRVLFGSSARELKRLDGITRGPVLTHTMETMQGLVPIRAIGIEKYFWKDFLELLDCNCRYLFHLGMLTPWMILRLNLVANIFILGVCLSTAGLRHVFNGSALGLGVAYALNIMGKLQILTRSTVELEQMLTSAERLDHLRDAPTEAAATGDEPSNSSWLQEGHVEVQSLNVRYREGLPLVLKDVSFSLPGGTKLGVIGRSGCGKSTLMQALLRLVEPESGCVKLDGTDIQTIGGKALRRRVAVIPQDPYLWRGSLRINLDPLNEYSEEAMLKALEVCQIKDRFDNLLAEEGGVSLLDAGIEDAGANLSIGERQLLCLCRAILKQAPVCLLDEATANIDAATEEKIQHVLGNALATATVMVVAHRLQTVRSSDLVLRMDAGSVADFGPPSTVLQAASSKRASALGLQPDQPFIVAI